MSLGLLKRITFKPSKWTHLYRPQIKRINTDFSNYKIFTMPENSTAAMKKQMNGEWKSAYELFKLDETNEGFDNFDPALKSTIKLEMAYSLRMMKNYSESVKYYEQYLFMDDPNQPKFDLFNIKTLWSLYLRTNKSKYAEGLFETYLNSLPLYHVENGVKSTNMARIDLKHHYGIFLRDEMQQFQQALDIFLEIVHESPYENAVIYAEISMCYVVIDPREAVEWMDKAINKVELFERKAADFLSFDPTKEYGKIKEVFLCAYYRAKYSEWWIQDYFKWTGAQGEDYEVEQEEEDQLKEQVRVINYMYLICRDMYKQYALQRIKVPCLKDYMNEVTEICNQYVSR